MSKEMLNALDVLEAEKGIPKDTVIEALQAALVSAYKDIMDKQATSKLNLNQKGICCQRSNRRSI